MEYRPEYKKKAIRSYVIRAGRMTDGQRSAFERWWPQYGLSLFDGPLDYQQAFGNNNPVNLEVGFGMGDSLLQMAQEHPEENFIGIEVHPPGVGRLINSAGEHALSNLKVYMADAVDVLEDCIKDGSLQRFQLYFPDPWHKKKHHKRRIVQTDFVNLLTDKLVENGVVHMATDWQEYAEQMLEELKQAPRLSNSAEGYSSRPAYRPKTKFESRGERLGHGVWDLVFYKRA